MGKPLSDWADRVVNLIAVALRTGNFDVARHHLEQLERRGLNYCDKTPETVTVETFIAQIFDDRTATTLERNGVMTFGDLLNLRPETLMGFPNIGPSTVQTILAVCREHFPKAGRP